jgi:hypothetical protein
MFAISMSVIIASFGPIGPTTPLPAELEVCILKAEVCVQRQQAPLCGRRLPDLDSAGVCSALYETCAEPFPEAHQPACRIDYIWCLIEGTADMEGSSSDFLKWCSEVFDTCPST